MTTPKDNRKHWARDLKVTLWTLILPPTIWAVHFMFCYLWVAVTCAKSPTPGTALNGFPLATLIATIVALLGIVAALLRIRELEDHARRSRFATVDLARLVEDACELHRPTAEDRGIDLTCDITSVGSVEGDASLLMEAVSNLIDNAMKFGPANGRVLLSLRHAGGAVVVTVADDGPGVPRAERSLVTQRFYRGRQDCEGAGLGLSLVNAIADLHGFTLAFADVGSAVSLVAPARG